MKADELAQIYINAVDKDSARHEIVISLFDDYEQLFQKRKPKTVDQYQSLLKEINDKWNAVDRRVNGELVKDGFYYVFAELQPEIKQFLPKLQ
jgi:hypothetical protein